jgi:hypothetical protein
LKTGRYRRGNRTFRNNRQPKRRVRIQAKALRNQGPNELMISS